MPKWLTLILGWGGVAVVVISAIALIYVESVMPTPEAAATPGETAAPITLYWVLLVIGAVAAVVGYFADKQRKPARAATASRYNCPRVGGVDGL